MSRVIEPLEDRVGHRSSTESRLGLFLAIRAGFPGRLVPCCRSCAGGMVQIRSAGMAAHSPARDIHPRSVPLWPLGSGRMPCLGWEHSEGHRPCSLLGVYRSASPVKQH